MSGWETTINSGNPDYDRQTVEHYRQQVAAQGMTLQVQPLPSGGYHVRAVPMQQQGFGAPSGFGAPAAAMAGPASAAGVAQPGTAQGALTDARVAYLRKVYGLLAGACAAAILSGFAILELSGTAKYAVKVGGKTKQLVLPWIVVEMATNPILFWGSFGLLVLATFIAGWVSKIRVVNVIALFAVAVIMGVELAPMVMVAQIMAGFGGTVSSEPVRDAFLLTGGIFAGVTGYVFITRKNFSYLGAILSMGVVVVFVACILAIFMNSEIFTLAVCSVGALLAGLFLLWQTSMVLHGDMDDPVGDALVFLVQLRNLFMFILRILMSRGE